MPIPGIIASSITSGLVTGSFESIATVAGTGSANSVSFTSIPATYTHLQIRFIGKSTSTAPSALYTPTITVNGVSGNYAWHRLSGNGTTVSASQGTTTTAMSLAPNFLPSSGAGYSNMFAIGIIDIIDYTSTTKAKTIRTMAGGDFNGSGVMLLSSGLYYGTPAAITSISINIPTGNWTTTSQFSLYGIKG